MLSVIRNFGDKIYGHYFIIPKSGDGFLNFTNISKQKKIFKLCEDHVKALKYFLLFNRLTFILDSSVASV